MKKHPELNLIDLSVIRAMRAANRSRVVVGTVALLLIIGGCNAYQAVRSASLSGDCEIARAHLSLLETQADLIQIQRQGGSAEDLRIQGELAETRKAIDECAKWGL